MLAGINDSAEVLAILCERLDELSIQPYYLHLLDPVQGAAHFDIDHSHALSIYRQLCGLLPGTLTPKLSREEAGGNAKTVFSNVE